MSNEAAERLLALIERGGDRVALRVNANLALAAERKAGAGDERFWIRAAISNLYGGIPEADGDYAIGFDAAKSKALTILDAEAAR